MPTPSILIATREVRCFALLALTSCGGKLEAILPDGGTPPDRFECGCDHGCANRTTCVLGAEYCLESYPPRKGATQSPNHYECKSLPLPNGELCTSDAGCSCGEQDGWTWCPAR